MSAVEQAWGEYRDGPDYQPTDRHDVRDVFVAGWAARDPEAEDWHKLIESQGNLLTGAVNALRGDPPPLTWWSHHDVAELATALRSELEDERSKVAFLEGEIDKYAEVVMAVRQANEYETNYQQSQRITDALDAAADTETVADRTREDANTAARVIETGWQPLRVISARAGLNISRARFALDLLIQDGAVERNGDSYRALGEVH